MARHTSASLVMLFKNRHGEYDVLVHQRARHLHHGGGLLAVPGGDIRSGDADHFHTALRETMEETGFNVVDRYYHTSRCELVNPHYRHHAIIVVVANTRWTRESTRSRNWVGIDRKSLSETTPGFSADESRTRWVPVSELYHGVACENTLVREIVSIWHRSADAIAKAVEHVSRGGAAAAAPRSLPPPADAGPAPRHPPTRAERRHHWVRCHECSGRGCRHSGSCFNGCHLTNRHNRDPELVVFTRAEINECSSFDGARERYARER